MLDINFKKMMMFGLTAVTLVAGIFVISSILCANEVWAAGGNSSQQGQVFGTLIAKGSEIFTGMREIIFAVSGFGIIAVAVGGFFGNLNWKWLSAIGIGLFILSTTSAIVTYMVGERPGSFNDVQEAIKTGGD